MKYRWWMKEFEEFHNKLIRHTESKCVGCRNKPIPGSGCVEGCIIPACVIEHEVDYCGDCPEFPCQRGKDFFITINRMIGQDWEKGSNRIKEIGIAKYFDEKKNLSHYISYKKD